MGMSQHLRAPIGIVVGAARHARGIWRERDWTEIPRQMYAKAFERLGGSFPVHPRVVSLFAELAGCRVRYLALIDGGRTVAAIPVWDHEVAVSKWALERHGLQELLDVGEGELVLPVEQGGRIALPCAARMISALHEREIEGLQKDDSTLAFARGHAIGQDRLSGTFLSQRRRELRKFREAGGRAQPIAELSGPVVAGIYRDLFSRRWGRPPQGSSTLDRVLSSLFDLLSGHVLWSGSAPVAVQLCYRHETPRGLLAVGVNGAIDPAFRDCSPGSLLYFLNVAALEEQSSAAGQALRYCFGRSDAGYKALWCFEQGAYRVS